MEQKEYRTALYLRLSRDERDGEGRRRAESGSIASQRELLYAYMREHGELTLWEVYTDDGYSGTDFHRPAFRRMMEDMEKGLIQCVLVKDLSRLGRDYIEAGRLIQKVFPALGVRFIAVTDRYDSLTAAPQERQLLLPMKNFMNDSYCRDISRKVRSGQRIKREQGLFLGAFAAYGYEKKEKNRLCVDPYAALVVRWIFAWRLEGLSLLAIARRLEGLGILSPLEYKRLHGQRFTGGFPSRVQGGWSPSAVKRILTNELYTGIMVQGKTARINYKVKRSVEREKKDWVRVEGTHQALVSKGDFRLAQQLLQTPVRRAGQQEGGHCFSGRLFCGDCKKPMILRNRRCQGKERLSFVCQTRNKGEGCTRHSIWKEELLEVVRQVVELYGGEWSRPGEALEEARRDRARQSQVVKREALLMRQEGEAYRMMEERLKGKEDEGLFCQEERQSLGEIYGKKGEALLEASRRQERLAEGLSAWTGMEAEEALGDRAMILTFVERIEVFEDRRLFICLRWRKEE